MNTPIDTNPRYINLVLQGGGVRGIAYVGALSAMPSNIRIREVAGTSAGAIVAGLLAIGKTPTEIGGILADVNFSKFLHKDDRARFQRLAEVGSKLRRALETGSLPDAVSALRSALKHRAEIRDVVAQRGFYRTDELKKWLQDIFEGKRFSRSTGNLVLDNLHVVSSDLDQQQFKDYNKDDTPNVYIADAVLASIAIPVFFRPIDRTPELLVDGGLLSNYPGHIFGRSHYPTVGFRLFDIPVKTDLTGAGFLKGLLLTMLTAHDKKHRPANYFDSFDIDTGNISSTNFDLTATDIGALRNAGLLAGQQVPWRQIAVPRPVVRHFDPKPDRALDVALQATQELFEAYGRMNVLPDTLVETVRYRHVITSAYESRIHVDFRFEVTGSTPLLATRIRLFDLPPGMSIVDTAPSVACQRGSPYTIVGVPAINGAREKAYVHFFCPPVSDAIGPCEWQLTASIKDDMTSMTSGGDDTVVYKSRLRAKHHEFDLTMEILIAADLSQYRPYPAFECELRQLEDIAYDNAVYRKFELKVPKHILRATEEFRVDLRV